MKKGTVDSFTKTLHTLCVCDVCACVCWGGGGGVHMRVCVCVHVCVFSPLTGYKSSLTNHKLGFAQSLFCTMSVKSVSATLCI